MKNDNKNVLHGNVAKVPHGHGFVPRFTNYVGNERGIREFREGAVSSMYNKLGDDAEFMKNQVDDVQL
ncbi:MAG: hypothetical protein LBN40_04405 [Oscillospiraceae bacterium]|jgi:hypothetical protein|nr:hypothetical protein [Oscillospiraceae bacterium]